ncbi:MAG: FliA/WhiG family RNA polymerase sigma factor [Oscillospiraceae bacterium]|jgi:RNA polymerase sigma factor for flagellar operon FliA|nr:FliA/WhiG family RNA polymerase sigma factor [Oscillospiraceae bacterium]
MAVAEANRERGQSELNALWVRYKKDDDTAAKDELLLYYTYLIKWTVHRLMPKLGGYAERDDLFSCGIIGLMDAMEKFDLSQGFKFETYALPRVRGEIIDFIRSQDWAPASLRRKISAINEAYERLENETGETPSDRTVAESLDIPVSQVQKILGQQHVFSIVNFEDAVSSGGFPRALEVPDDGDKQPENSLMERELRESLAVAIEALPEKERLVITLYYYDGLLLREIADMLGITESRVSQIHSKALARMSVKLGKLV